MAFCPNCGTKQQKESLFCMNCGFAINKTDKDIENDNHDYTNNFKCPHCGHNMKAFEVKCPYCGNQLRGINPTRSIEKLSEELRESKNDHEKASVIRHFPIPNTREDIWEFVILASSIVDSHINDEVSSAWTIKLEQVIQKARISFEKGPELEKIENSYTNIIKMLNRSKKVQTIKHVGISAAEFIPVIPQTAIIFLWLFSIALLLSKTHSGSTSSVQLLIIIDYITGIIIIPLMLRNESPLPKLITASGGLLSIILMIMLSKKNSIFVLLIIIATVCLAVVFFRSHRYNIERSIKTQPVNGISLAITLASIIALVATYGIGSIFATRSNDKIIQNKVQITEDTQANIANGIYTYQLRDYTGRNVANVGKVVSGVLTEQYGRGQIRIVLVTQNGTYLAPDDESEKKKYTVIGQNIPAGSDVIVVHQKDSKGKPSNYLVDYQSYEVLVLYVAPIGKTASNIAHSELQPTMDKHCFFIRDYIGWNAASFKRNNHTQAVDTYGEAEVRLSFASVDGRYIDVNDDNVMRNYVVVGQNFPPNTELKIEYYKNSKGNESYYIVQSQSIDEITLTVKPINK